jgi:cell division protein FtsL
MAIGAAILLILGWTWKGVYVDALSIKKARLLVEAEEIQGRQKHLISELASSRSFARIDRLARDELHMQYANRPPRILEVPGLKIMDQKPDDMANRDRSFASIK